MAKRQVSRETFSDNWGRTFGGILDANADSAVYRCELTREDIARLYAGESPRKVRPESLVSSREDGVDYKGAASYETVGKTVDWDPDASFSEVVYDSRKDS